MSESIEALTRTILEVTWPDGGRDGMPTRKTAGMIAEHLLAAGFVRPEDVAEALLEPAFVERVARMVYDRFGADASGHFDDDWITNAKQTLECAAAALRPVDAPEGGASRG